MQNEKVVLNHEVEKEIAEKENPIFRFFRFTFKVNALTNVAIRGWIGFHFLGFLVEI